MRTDAKRSVLLVADTPGHILEGLGRAWRDHSDAFAFELVCSAVVHPYVCNRRRFRHRLVHWIDPNAFRRSAGYMQLPQVVSLHHLTEAMRPHLAATFFHADAIVASARTWQRELSALSDREVFLMPYGVDSRVFAFEPDKARARRALGIAAEDFVVGFVGKAGADVENRKGTDVFRQVVPALKDAVGPATLLIVGPGWEPLSGVFTRAGVRVVRRQYADNRETPAAYAAMDALLVTSRVEGGPCTLLEAMACGTPVISSNVGHVPEILTDGENGFVCPNRTAGEYLQRLRLLRTDAGLRQRVIAAGRACIEKDRDDAVLVKRIPFAECYASALHHHAQRSAADHLARAAQQPVFALRYLASATLKRARAARERSAAAG